MIDNYSSACDYSYMHEYLRHSESEQVENSEDRFDLSPDFRICRSDVLDSVYESELINKGYRFLDRLLCYEIETGSIGDFDTGLFPGVDFLCDNVYDERIFHTAFQAFTTDRRFHLKPVFDQQAANDMIRAYIEHCRKKEYRVFKAVHDNELLGFLIADDTDQERDFFENVLGAAGPGIKGKMIAGPLYRFVISYEKDSFRKYVGRVSSSNAASINLHNALGGKVKKIYDEFVLDNRR